MASLTSLTTNLGLSQVPETDDRKLFFELQKVYNAINALARNLDSYTGATSAAVADMPEIGVSSILLQRLTRLYLLFDETVVSGAMINVYNNSGVLHARLAKAADGTKPARAVAVAATTSGEYGELLLLGALPFYSGLTPGTLYYLSPTSTSGQITAVKPVTAGQLVQPVGFALSTSSLFFNPTLEGDIV